MWLSIKMGVVRRIGHLLLWALQAAIDRVLPGHWVLPRLEGSLSFRVFFWEASRRRGCFADWRGPAEHVWTAPRMLRGVGRFTQALALAFTTPLPPPPPSTPPSPLSRPPPRGPPQPPPPFFPTPPSPQAGESPLTFGWRCCAAAVGGSRRRTGNAAAAAILTEPGAGRGPREAGWGRG